MLLDSSLLVTKSVMSENKLLLTFTDLSQMPFFLSQTSLELSKAQPTYSETCIGALQQVLEGRGALEAILLLTLYPSFTDVQQAIFFCEYRFYIYYHVQGITRPSSDLLKSAKTLRKGEPTKNAIQWTRILTPRAPRVITRPNKGPCLLCRGKKPKLWGGTLHMHTRACQRVIKEGIQRAARSSYSCNSCPFSLVFLGFSMPLDTLPYSISLQARWRKN